MRSSGCFLKSGYGRLLAAPTGRIRSSGCLRKPGLRADSIRPYRAYALILVLPVTGGFEPPLPGAVETVSLQQPTKYTPSASRALSSSPRGGAKGTSCQRGASLATPIYNLDIAAKRLGRLGAAAPLCARSAKSGCAGHPPQWGRPAICCTAPAWTGEKWQLPIPPLPTAWRSGHRHTGRTPPAPTPGHERHPEETPDTGDRGSAETAIIRSSCSTI